ncbi:MAG: diaminopimelate epimerase, partial [Methylicorpusculum sp.]|nr:diaminopimelate epimerase [Methylicorpusculum sp.]
MIKFTKMHGLGNDFVVIDAIHQNISLSSEQIRFIAHRHFGIGCDQVLLVEPPVSDAADFKYRIFNADGSEVSQCGNGARCFAKFVRDKQLTEKDEILVDTNSGQLLLSFDRDGMITVNMGIPKHNPAEIPLLASVESRFYTAIVNN